MVFFALSDDLQVHEQSFEDGLIVITNRRLIVALYLTRMKSKANYVEIYFFATTTLPRMSNVPASR